MRVLLLLTVSAVLVGPTYQILADPKPPNVVFVLADDLGYGDVGFHDPSIYTPTLDKLAADGVRLENYYVQPMCSPTRGQLLTGRYQIHYGLVHGAIPGGAPEGIPLDEQMLPQTLKTLGYRTHMVGKWHLGHFKNDYLPYNRGFDSFYGLLLAGGDHYTHMGTYTSQTGRGGDHGGGSHSRGRRTAGHGGGTAGHGGGTAGHGGGKSGHGGGVEYLDLRDNNGPIFNETGHYSTLLFTEKAMDIIRAQSSDKPFFLYLAYQAVHSPLQVPAAYENLNSHIKNDHRRGLAGMVSVVDEGVRNITTLLKDKGLWDNTVLIFCGDNGAPAGAMGGRNWPYRGGKASLWEGGIKSAGIVNGGYIRDAVRGTISKDLIHVSDWYPTIVKGLAGGKLTGGKPLDGVNQWPTINSQVPSARSSILHNIDVLETPVGTTLHADSFDNRIQAALRQGEMKLLTGYSGRYNYWMEPADGGPYNVPVNSDPADKNLWLFNLTSDPYETMDLSASQPAVVRAMLDELLKYQQTAVPAIQSRPDPNADPGLHGGVFGPWM